MTYERKQELEDNNKITKLTQQELIEGWHYCNESDGFLHNIGNAEKCIYCNFRRRDYEKE